jgi:hypothetical protein
MLVALMRTIRLSGMVFPALMKSLIILCSLVGIQCVIAGVLFATSTMFLKCSIQRQTEPLQIFLRPVALYFCVQQRLKNRAGVLRFCV